MIKKPNGSQFKDADNDEAYDTIMGNIILYGRIIFNNTAIKNVNV